MSTQHDARTRSNEKRQYRAQRCEKSQSAAILSSSQRPEISERRRMNQPEYRSKSASFRMANNPNEFERAGGVQSVGSTRCRIARVRKTRQGLPRQRPIREGTMRPPIQCVQQEAPRFISRYGDRTGPAQRERRQGLQFVSDWQIGWETSHSRGGKNQQDVQKSQDKMDYYEARAVETGRPSRWVRLRPRVRASYPPHHRCASDSAEVSQGPFRHNREEHRH